MKTVGLIGGMSWESTLSYYKGINEGVKKSLGGLHSAKVCLYSVDFAEIENLQHQGEWDKTAEILSSAAQSIETGGADFFLICTNTMHKVAEIVEKSVSIPLLHIADATGERLAENGIKRVGLLGTRFTMEQGFYKNRLSEKFDIEVVVPNADDRNMIHHIIYTELCLGQIKSSSRNEYVKVIDNLHNQRVEAVILGCTEIALLVQQSHTNIRLYDTTEIHVEQAVRLAIGE